MFCIVAIQSGCHRDEVAKVAFEALIRSCSLKSSSPEEHRFYLVTESFEIEDAGWFFVVP